MAREKMSDKVARLEAENRRLSSIEVFARKLLGEHVVHGHERSFTMSSSDEPRTWIVRCYCPKRADAGWTLILDVTPDRENSVHKGAIIFMGNTLEAQAWLATGTPYEREINSWLSGLQAEWAGFGGGEPIQSSVTAQPHGTVADLFRKNG